MSHLINKKVLGENPKDEKINFAWYHLASLTRASDAVTGRPGVAYSPIWLRYALRDVFAKDGQTRLSSTGSFLWSSDSRYFFSS